MNTENCRCYVQITKLCAASFTRWKTASYKMLSIVCSDGRNYTENTKHSVDSVDSGFTKRIPQQSEGILHLTNSIERGYSTPVFPMTALMSLNIPLPPPLKEHTQ